MSEVKTIKSDIIEKKLPNGLFEVKQEDTDRKWLQNNRCGI